MPFITVLLSQSWTVTPAFFILYAYTQHVTILDVTISDVTMQFFWAHVQNLSFSEIINGLKGINDHFLNDEE